MYKLSRFVSKLMIFKIPTDINLLDKNSNISFLYVFCFPSPKSEFKYMIPEIIWQ